MSVGLGISLALPNSLKPVGYRSGFFQVFSSTIAILLFLTTRINTMKAHSIFKLIGFLIMAYGVFAAMAATTTDATGWGWMAIIGGFFVFVVARFFD